MLGIEPNEDKLEETRAILHKSEKIMEDFFLQETRFINSNKISIADLQAMCEFTQYWLAGVNPFKDKPRLAKWMEDCKRELQPHFNNTHKMVYKAREEGIFKGKL
jgi:glutathione S-transferase